MLYLQTLKDWATLVGVSLAAVSLVYTAYSARLTLKTNRARFWLDLRNEFAQFDSVHLKLRPGGHWTKGGQPESNEEWALVEAYMSLFEHCELMIRDGLLDRKTFEDIYKYRVGNLLASRDIVKAKLIDERDDWKNFLDLVSRFGLTGFLPSTNLK